MGDFDDSKQTPKSIESFLSEEFQECADFSYRTFPEIQASIFYFDHLVGKKDFARDVIEPLSNIGGDDITKLLKRSQYVKESDQTKIVKGILDGQVVVTYSNTAYLVKIPEPATRAVERSETETTINGPQDAFVETVRINLSLLRKRVRSSHLKVLKLTVGEISKSDVYLLYIKDIANEKLIHTLRNRIEQIEVDSVPDVSILIQEIEDSPYSVFPTMLTTERPDVVESKLYAGKVICMIENSPTVCIAPTDFFEFFSSPDDYYQRSLTGSGLRVLRFLAFMITISFTAFYVSVTTFHYEMIPQTMLTTLVESRSRVPFSPIYEALLMETTIELLREASARLPTKIGQTIGTVGGLVIGQAAVQAGLTSNILIIAVAISAIASFVIPSYVMSASIRLLRFGLILLAGFLGNFGLVAGLAGVIIHISGLTSLKVSYLTPVAPMYIKNWKDTFIRAPFAFLKGRPVESRSRNTIRNRMKK